MLLALEISVVSDDLLNNILVWGGNMMMLQQPFITLVNRSPARNFFVESKVAEHNSRGSRDSRAAVNVNFVVLAVHKIVQVLGGGKSFLDVLIFIVVIDRVVDGRLDTFVLVKLLHFCP